MLKHIPVLRDEVIHLLNIQKDGVYLDLTLGRAGHASEILKRLSSKGKVIGFDQDLEAIKYSKIVLSKISKNFEALHANFVTFPEVLKKLNIYEVDGILLDLGVSSPQFDDPSRGFSYRNNAPLDMRMNTSQDLSAKEVVNFYSLEALVKVFREYGEDKYSYQVAKNIIQARKKKLIETTSELVEIIKLSKPIKELAKKGHPAKQIFQALRIEVNDELNVLEQTITKALAYLKPGGRLAIISFHSLEDRLVKQMFNKKTKIEGTRINDFLLPHQIKKEEFRLINRKVICPSQLEQTNNPRSKSAKLRVVERLKESEV
ncbi:MAG: 16S rRNA (cytosine(1402)-N(4))-methyltransferase RsmH [Bacilli bacterium]|jgi:16S rRNA (cytosine1402-N4)-methyltransferase|nr:16S rRNA (cytosine(1402)-N(4))-methyltransferase RsmH [Bacilli bacterium]NLN80725.1 16S rRNA (cytosine(1402)-N(4))-methyltransferase RsmH [Erysipelotrichia bacterium]